MSETELRHLVALATSVAGDWPLTRLQAEVLSSVTITTVDMWERIDRIRGALPVAGRR